MVLGLFGFGGPQFGLRDAKIAPNNLNGTFGTSIDVPSVQLFGIQYQTTTADLTGDDGITAVQAIATSATMTLRFGSVSLQVLEVITGKAIQSSGNTPNRVNRMYFDKVAFPYFAVAGQALAAESVEGGDTHLFVPKIKITDGFEVRFEYGAFAIPEITARALPDPQYAVAPDTIFVAIEHETGEAIAIPPA